MSEDVRAGIVEAATRLLREKGAAGVTTRAVAQAAGVQAPAIYRLFGDKDGLVNAVAEHVMAGYVAAKSTAEVDDDPVRALRDGWRMHVDFGLANAELFALLNSVPTAAGGIDVLRARVRALAAAGLLRVPEERALNMIHAAGTGTVLALLGLPATRRDPGLSEAMFDALCAGLLSTAPATPDTAVSTVVVTFATVVPDLPGITEAERTLLAEWLARALAELQRTRS